MSHPRTLPPGTPRAGTVRPRSVRRGTMCDAAGVWRRWRLAVDADEVLRAEGADAAGLRARHSPAAAVADVAVRIGTPLLRPAIAWRRAAVAGHRHGALLLGPSSVRLSGDSLVRNLHGACNVVAMLCTVGGEVEAEVSRRFGTQPALALDLDTLASVAFQRLVSAARQKVAADAERLGLQVGPPISPGQGGWPLAIGQRQLFALVDGAVIGVRASASGMMEPRKSCSLLLGVGADLGCARSPCEDCELSARCTFRHLDETDRAPGAAR
jgi:hypothetical protein